MTLPSLQLKFPILSIHHQVNRGADIRNAGCLQQELNLYMETWNAISIQALDFTSIINYLLFL